MKKKKFIPYFVIFLLIAGVLFYVRGRRLDRGYHSFLAIACSAQKYTEEEGNGYLTIMLETSDGIKSKVIEVKEREIRAQLTSANLEEVIGVNLAMNLSHSYIEENHLDTKTLDPLRLLTESDVYDDYFQVVGISTEKNS